MTLLVTFLNIAIFQGIVLGFIILKSPIFKSKANKYLAFGIFSLSISLLNFVLDEGTGIYNTYPLLRFIDIIDSGTLFPIFIFLYVVHQIDHPLKKSRKKIWLFIPYLFSLIHSILDEDPINNALQIPSIIQLSSNIIEILIIFLFIPGIIIYTYTFIKLSNNTQEKKWLTYLWLLTFTLFGSWVLILLFGIFLDFEFASIIMILTLIAAFLMHWISYFGIFKFRIAKDQEEIRALLAKRKLNHTRPVIKKPEQSTTDSVTKSESLTKENSYFKKLESLCINDHIYRDSTLDREKVAELLDISPGYVSRLVNSTTGDNFSTYINRFRVEEVKKMMSDPEFEHYNLLAIGLECGFSSKTTFYNSFKKHTGMTPSAYKKTQK